MSNIGGRKWTPFIGCHIWSWEIRFYNLAVKIKLNHSAWMNLRKIKNGTSHVLFGVISILSEIEHKSPRFFCFLFKFLNLYLKDLHKYSRFIVQGFFRIFGLLAMINGDVLRLWFHFGTRRDKLPHRYSSLYSKGFLRNPLLFYMSHRPFFFWQITKFKFGYVFILILRVKWPQST